MTFDDPYSVLGVSATATTEQIYAAYSFLTCANNPKMFNDAATQAQAAETSKQVATAYAQIRANRESQTTRVPNEPCAEQKPKATTPPPPNQVAGHCSRTLMSQVPEQHIQRKRQIAEFLVASETSFPGSIRLYPNPGRTSTAIQLLAEIGYRKPFLKSANQFAIDCFLSYPDACDRLLTHCMLICSDDQARQHVWNGYGVFKKCFPTIPRFEGHEPIIYAVNIKPVVLAMTELLDPNPVLQAEEEQQITDKLRDFFEKNPPPKIIRE